MGSRLAALRAGYQPKNIPVNVQTKNEMMTEYNKTDTGHPKSERSANAAPTPKATPIIPPETLMMND